MKPPHDERRIRPVEDAAVQRQPDAVVKAPLLVPGAEPPPPPTLNPLIWLYRFWCRPVRAEPMAAFRICLGVVILLSTLTSLLPYLDLYMDPETGLCPPDSLNKPPDGWLKRSGRFCLVLGPVSLPPDSLLKLWPFDELAAMVPEGVATRKVDVRVGGMQVGAVAMVPEGVAGWWKERGKEWEEWAKTRRAIYLFFFLWVASVALMTVGLFTRTSTIVAWALTVSFHHRLTWLNNGGDSLFRVGLFYLMLMPSGAVWSLDYVLRRRWAAWKAAWRGLPLAPPRPVRVPPWSLRLAQIQICMVYLFTGLVKALVYFPANSGDTWGQWAENDWINGQAVYWVLNDLSLNRFPYESFPIPLVVCALLSWLTLIFEIGFPVFVSFRVLRPWLLLGGVAFHFGIWFHTEVGWFSFVTISWYPLFLSGEFLARVVTGKRAKRKPAASASERTPAPALPARSVSDG
jgi:hypothetical protein